MAILYMFGLDIVGLLPIMKKKEEFLIIGTEYFTKRVEVEPTCHITQDEVYKCNWHHHKIWHFLYTDYG